MGFGRERLGQRGCAGLLRPPGSTELQWEQSKTPLPAGRGKASGTSPWVGTVSGSGTAHPQAYAELPTTASHPAQHFIHRGKTPVADPPRRLG